MGEKSKKEQEKTYEENKKEIRLLRSKCNKVTIYYGILSCNFHLSFFFQSFKHNWCLIETNNCCLANIRTICRFEILV